MFYSSHVLQNIVLGFQSVLSRSRLKRGKELPYGSKKIMVRIVYSGLSNFGVGHLSSK